MPTFRNDTNKLIEYTAWVRSPTREATKSLISFRPNGEEEKPLEFWVPYLKLGLTLVDAAFPPVPENILANGTFPITDGATREFTIDPCDAYTVDVIAQSGTVIVYFGSNNAGVEVSAESPTAYRYKGVQDWEYSPYITVEGIGGGEFTICAEVCRDMPGRYGHAYRRI